MGRNRKHLPASKFADSTKKSLKERNVGSWYEQTDCNNNDLDNKQDNSTDQPSASKRKGVFSEDHREFQFMNESIGGNSIINLSSLEEAINQFTCCKLCQSQVQLTEK